MEFRILGRIEAIDGESPVELGPHKQRSLLALLLVHRGTVVSTDRIIDELWGDDARPERQNTLWVYISNLRKALEPDRERGSEGTFIHTREPGYVFSTHAAEVDADRFETLLTEGRALQETDPGAASLVLGEALAMWRGHPLEDFTYEAFAQGEIARLAELRLEAVEARVDAELARGRSRELVGELEGLVRAHPLRERLAGQLMLALYRSGRQAEALRTYRAIAGRLAADLGIEPSAELRRLEERMVLGEAGPDLTGPVRLPGDDAGGLSVRGYEVRDKLADDELGATYRAFQPALGREVAIKVVPPGVADDPSFIRGFEEGARIVSRLESPHIVPLYDYWREPGAAYLVTPLVPGGTLAERIARGPADTAAAAELVEHVGGALEAAHRAGVAHGALDASDVLLDQDGNAYLTGFGLMATTTSFEDAVHADITGLAALVAETLTGRVGDVTELRVGLQPDVAEVIGDAVDADGERFADVRSLRKELLGALRGVPSPPHAAVPADDVVNPYKGLRAFEQADAEDFFGRDRLVERIVARMGRPGQVGRFLAVVGPSGSGKSSAVKAGLLPALRTDALPASSEWFQIEMVPGAHPFEELEKALLGVAVNPPASLLEQLTGDGGLRRAVDRVLADDHSQLLIVVDQLEELFTQAAPDRAAAFLDAIVDAVSAERSRIRVVATLRADFYDRPLQHRRFGELLRGHTEIVTPMSPEELQAAIAQPARACGVEFDPAVVVEMATEVTERPTALPLLQYTLTELFDKRGSSIIGPADYRAIGGVTGALAERAEGLYRVQDEEGRRATRQIFLRLVSVSEGAEDTRRRVLVAELTGLEDAGDNAQQVIDAFGRHRLLSFDRDPVTRGPTVEISHEALLREWQRLTEWIDDARADLLDHRRLAAAAGEWIGADRDPDFLLRGPQLERLAAWAAQSSLTLAEGERAFLDASTAERDRRRAEELAAERAHEEKERQLERRSLRRMQWLVGVLVVASLVATGLTAFALNRNSEAQESARLAEANALEADTNAREARARELANAAVIDIEVDSERAVLLAVEAVETTRSADGTVLREAEEALHRAIVGHRETTAVPGWLKATYLPDGSLLAAGFRTILWSETGEEILRLGSDIVSVAASVDGTMLATGDVRGAVGVWNAATGQRIRGLGLPAHDGYVLEVEFSPDGTLLASASPDDRSVRVWDVETGSMILEVEGLPGWGLMPESPKTAFSPNGSKLAVTGILDFATDVAETRVYDLATGEWDSLVGDVSFNAVFLPDGRLITSSWGTLYIWDSATGRQLGSLGVDNEEARVFALAMSGNGTRLAAGGDDSLIRLWDVDAGSIRRDVTLRGHTTPIMSLAFDTAGDRLASVELELGRDAHIRVWDTSKGASREWATWPGGGPALAYAPDGTTLAMSRPDRVALVGVPSGEDQSALIDPNTGAVQGIAWSPDGSVLATVSQSPAFAEGPGYVRLWNTSGDVLATLTELFPRVGIAFSPDGSRVAAALCQRAGSGWTTQAIVWDAASGAKIYSAPRSGCAHAADLGPGNLLAVQGDWPMGGEVEVFDIVTGERVASIGHTPSNVGAAEFSPDGAKLLTAGIDGAARVWDIASGTELASLLGHAGPVNRAVWSADGATIATGGKDGTVRLWNAADGRELLALRGHRGEVVGLSFHPDGTQLASSDSAETRVWALDIGDLLTIARQRVTRTLTASECETYHFAECPAAE